MHYRCIDNFGSMIPMISLQLLDELLAVYTRALNCPDLPRVTQIFVANPVYLL